MNIPNLNSLSTIGTFELSINLYKIPGIKINLIQIAKTNDISKDISSLNKFQYI